MTVGYSKETYEAARAELSRRKLEAEKKAEMIKENFLKLHPYGRELLDKIGSAGSRAAIAVLRGGNTRENLEKLRDENLMYQREFDSLLAENGLKKSDLKPMYICEKCQDTGYVNGIMCSCHKDLLKTFAFKNLNSISPLMLSGFDTISTEYYARLPEAQRVMMEKILDYCKSYADTFSINSPSLLFQGGTGLGKTHFSLAIAAAATEKGFGVLYGSVHSFASSIERQRFTEIDGEDTASLLCSADLLILDDLGTEFPSSYVSSALYNIVDSRIMRGLPTIISTNLEGEELQSRYGERLVSRLYGNYNKFRFVGRDIRMAKRGYNK